MVQIITDSSSLYTKEEGQKLGICAIPLCVSIGGKNFRDLEIPVEEFIADIDAGNIPFSSQPPLGDVVEAYETYRGKEMINISMAEEVLKDIISPNNKREVTPQVILEVVAEHYGVTPSDIIGSKRNAEIVVPRQIVMYLCREVTDTSYKNIGILLGNRDHSTVISGDNKVRDKLKGNDTKLKNNLDIIRKKLSTN